jgi:hypothetical protein
VIAINTKTDARKSIMESAKDPNMETEEVVTQPLYLRTIKVDATNNDAMDADLTKGSVFV